jgi:integrase
MIARIAPGSFAALIRAYQGSPQYRALAPGTRLNYNNVLRLAETPEALGTVAVAELRPALVLAFLDSLAITPGRRRTALVAFRAIERWALPREHMPRPITTGLTAKYDGTGHSPWSDEQVALAENCARPDLARAITLAVHTGQRGSDLVRMRWSDIERHDGRDGIRVTQQKTKLKLWVPFTTELSDVMAIWERRPPFFLLLKPSGKCYTRGHLSWAWNNERTYNRHLRPLDQAGLTLHGLRATAVVRARKAGASISEICALYGMSAPLVSVYSRLAEQPAMALAAIIRLEAASDVSRSRSNNPYGRV